jgi:hypothetical protein
MAKKALKPFRIAKVFSKDHFGSMPPCDTRLSAASSKFWSGYSDNYFAPWERKL